MTPKEKAEEIFNKYWLVESNVDSAPYTDKSMAKNCSLIAIDEIIQTLNMDIRDLDVVGNVLLDLIKYWQQVKQEIEKL